MKRLTEGKGQRTGNKKLMIIIAIVGIAIVIGIMCIFLTRQEKTDHKTPEQMAEGESVEEVQEKIKKQEEEIDKINKEMTPLIEEREQLEKQLKELTEEDTESTNLEQTVEQ